MLKTFWAIFCLWIFGLACTVQADNYTLADGTTLSGEPVTYGDTGIILRLPDDKYTERMPWTKFSQAALAQLAQTPKIKPFVEPFIAPPPAEKTASGDDIKVRPVTRLDMPPHQFILAALASSSVGLFLLFIVYAANLYAAFEVAACRGRPVGAVMGLSAVLPVVGPAIFFLMPTNMAAVQTTPSLAEASEAATAAHHAAAAAVLAERSEAAVVEEAVTAPKEVAVAQSFKRGQFTFNRRFFETKFPGFMLPVRSEADQKVEFTVKATQGSYVVDRIARIGQNEVYLEVLQNEQRQEVLVPFGDIQEITIKTKTA